MSITERELARLKRGRAGREGFRAERKRDVKGGGSRRFRPQDCTPARVMGRFPPPPPPRQPRQRHPGPRRSAAGPGGKRQAAAAGPEPTSLPGYPRPQRKEGALGARKMGQDKNSPPPTRKANHTPVSLRACRPGRPPLFHPGPRGVPVGAGGLGRDGRGGEEQGGEAGRVPTPVSPAGAPPLGRPPLSLRGPGTGAAAPRLRCEHPFRPPTSPIGVEPPPPRQRES